MIYMTRNMYSDMYDNMAEQSINIMNIAKTAKLTEKK